MNSYHFMNFPASPRSWPVRPPSWASASRGCHLGGIFPWDLRLFPRIFPCFSQICPRFMKEIIRNLIRFRIGCWILLNCSELFGTVVLDHLDRGTVFDVFIGALIPWLFFRPWTRLFWAWSRRCLNLFNLFNHCFLLKDVEPPLMLQLQHIQTKLYCCWYQHFFLASSFHEHLGSICQQLW